MCGDNSINVPANVAKERLEKLAKVNPATKLSGYEVQFKVMVRIEMFGSTTVCFEY